MADREDILEACEAAGISKPSIHKVPNGSTWAHWYEGHDDLGYVLTQLMAGRALDNLGPHDIDISSEFDEGCKRAVLAIRVEGTR